MRFASSQSGSLAALETPRSTGLELLSAAPVKTMREFYSTLLELRVLDEREDRITIAAGETPITFIQAFVHAQQADEKPFYRFAFKIPENKVFERLEVAEGMDSVDSHSGAASRPYELAIEG